DVKMEQGSLRCDVNLSLRTSPDAPLGTRTETKNVNSLRSVERAIRYEMQRQAALLADGTAIIQETRHWHEDTGVTTSGRVKSDAEDYRYFPEPDLVPVAPSAEWIEQLRSQLPEPPADRSKRLRQEWGISEKEMQSVINAGALDLVLATIAEGADPAASRKWWLGELARRANDEGVELESLAITAKQVADLEALVQSGRLNDKLARQVIDGVLAGEGEPAAVADSRGLQIVSDDSALLAAINEAIAADPDAAQKIRDGKVAAAGALVGAVMKATQGQADAGRVRELVLQELGQ
ncbi:MAG: Asp-tRNA(Asn)/Glu-tRNA(Gln) amidotransferase GatCAB subunit B, partial [Actinomycetes bacterium]